MCLPSALPLILRLRGNTASRMADVIAAGSLLSGLNVSENRLYVVPESSSVFVTDGMHFGDNRVNLKFLHFIRYPIAESRESRSRRYASTNDWVFVQSTRLHGTVSIRVQDQLIQMTDH